MAKIAYSYVRFSTKKQIEGDSLDRQLALARDYARRHNLDLDERTYQDLGLSAFKGKNASEGALRAFLDAVDDGTIPPNATLLVEAFDRLSRAEIMEAFDLFREIVKKGVTIVTLGDEQPYNLKTINENFGQLIISIVYMAKAHSESADKSRRIKHALQTALDNGKKHAKCPGWLEVSADRLSFTVLEDKANIVREVFEMRAKGIGSSRIAQHLNTTYGMTQSPPQIAHQLKNPSVIGTRVSQAGYAPILNYYPAIIDKVLFYDVQQLMSANIRTKRGQQPEHVPNLVRGIVYCGLCDERLRYFSKNSNVSQNYLKCQAALDKDSVIEGGEIKRKCTAGYINYDAFEKEMIGWLLLDQDEELVPLLEKRASRKATTSAEVRSLHEQQERLIELAAHGLMNTRLVTEKLNALELQIKDHEAAFVEQTIVVEDRLFPEKAWALAERHEDAKLNGDKESLHAARHELQAAFQRALDRIEVYPEVRRGSTHHCKFSVTFRGYDGKPTREYKRPALIRIKGVYNRRKPNFG